MVNLTYNDNLENRDLGRRIGLAVRHLRQLQGMTQEDLSIKANVQQSRISMLENGKRNQILVNLNDLERIAIHLGKDSLSSFIKFAEDIPNIHEIISKTKTSLKKMQELS